MLSHPKPNVPTEEGPEPRRLAALVHADMIGYSRLVGLDDAGTRARLVRLRREVIDPALGRYGGRLVNTAGDALLMAFDSATAAVRCAVEIQSRMADYDEGRAPERCIRFRIGVEIGDVLTEGTDLHGEGVNVAARLQAACPPGGVCISRAVREHVRGHLELPFTTVGRLNLKNIDHPVEAFVLRLDGSRASSRRRIVTWRMGISAVVLIVLGAGFAAWRWPDWITPHRFIEVSAPAGVGAPPLSIAVLPFANLSGDPEQAYLADGLSEDLTTDLSHLVGAVVIARESAFTYKGKQVDVREVGRQLGVRYVIEGSVRKLGDVVRMNVQLVSATTGAHVWAVRFDKPVRELESGLDDLAAQIGAALNVQLVGSEEIARGRRPPGNPGAFDLVLRARSVLNERPSDVRNAIARGLYEQALRIDPSSVPAMAGVAVMIVRGFDRRQTRRASDLLAEAERKAPEASDVLAAKFLLLRSLGRWEESVATFRRLLDKDSSAAGVAAQAYLCALCWGEPESAIPLLERTVRLNPRSPNSAVLYVELGRMLLLAGRAAEAIPWLERAAELTDGDNPSSRPKQPDGLVDAARLLLASAYAWTGHLGGAQRVLQLALQSERNMDVTVRSMTRNIPTYSDRRRTEQEQWIIEGLRRAGLRDHLDEMADSQIPADGRLRDLDQLDGPTPMSVPGGTTIRTEELAQLIAQSNPLVITTAAANPTVPGAIQVSMTVGGNTDDEWQARLDRTVEGLTGGDRHRLIVTFAHSLNRWHARNIALRLIALGYDNVFWYRGGWEAWDAHGLPKTPLILQAR